MSTLIAFTLALNVVVFAGYCLWGSRTVRDAAPPILDPTHPGLAFGGLPGFDHELPDWRLDVLTP